MFAGRVVWKYPFAFVVQFPKMVLLFNAFTTLMFSLGMLELVAVSTRFPLSIQPLC